MQAQRLLSPRQDGVSPERRQLGFERLVFFSDAVFAIAVTLLALDIRLPEIARGFVQQQLPGALFRLLIRLVLYALCFVVIGSFWYGHHRMFQYIQTYDGRLILLNLLFLMFVAAAPIPTRVLGDYFGHRDAVVFFAGYMLPTSLLQAFVWHYAISGHRLIDPALDTRFGTVLSYTAPIVFALSIGLAFINSLAAALSWLLIWLLQGIERKIYFSRSRNA